MDGKELPVYRMEIFRVFFIVVAKESVIAEMKILVAWLSILVGHPNSGRSLPSL